MRRTALAWSLVLCAIAGCSRSDPEVDRLLALLRNGDPAGTKLGNLGPKHSDGIPAILELMADDNRRFVQVTCFNALLSMKAGEDAVPASARAMKSGDTAVSDLARLVMWKIAPTAPDTENALRQLAVRARTDAAAGLLLRQAPPLSDAIATEFAKSEPLAVLAALGKSMRLALPRIKNSLDAPTTDERIAAAHALYRVSGELQPALDHLAVEFRTDNLFLRQRIHIVWVDMLRAQPAAMKAELGKLSKSEHKAVAQMAESMLGQ